MDFQEPIAAALLGTCILRQLAKKIPIGCTAKPEDFENNANEFEELAIGVKNLIQYCNICKYIRLHVFNIAHENCKVLIIVYTNET